MVGWFSCEMLKSIKKMVGLGKERKTMNQELKTSLNERA